MYTGITAFASETKHLDWDVTTVLGNGVRWEQQTPQAPLRIPGGSNATAQCPSWGLPEGFQHWGWCPCMRILSWGAGRGQPGTAGPLGPCQGIAHLNGCWQQVCSWELPFVVLSPLRRGGGRRTGMGELMWHVSEPEQVSWKVQCKFRAGKIHWATLFMTILHA